MYKNKERKKAVVKYYISCKAFWRHVARLHFWDFFTLPTINFRFFVPRKIKGINKKDRHNIF